MLLDLRPAYDSSKTLLGYFVFTWFSKYIEVVTSSIRRLVEGGLIEDMETPTELGRKVIFDFGALNLERLAYVTGIYFYVLSSHKYANGILMNQQDLRHVLYLRGYEFEVSASADGGMAVGMSTIDTQKFTNKLRDLISDHVQVFKIMSPKDMYWETVEAQNYFYSNFSGMIGLIRQRPASIYMSALDWKSTMLDLLGRMDHFVVYLSSITESAMWEIEQLDKPEYRDRVTIVFDEDAINLKQDHLNWHEGLQKEFGDELIWRKKTSSNDLLVKELRERLAKRFLLVTPEEFEKEIDQHRERIQKSAGSLVSHARDKWIDFPWQPALPKAELGALLDLSNDVQKRIEKAMKNGIEAPTLFLADVQLRIYMTLLMGEHGDTGRALASYGAVMQASLDYYELPEHIGALTMESRESHLEKLRAHRDYADYAAVRLLGYGSSHEFEDRSAAASAETDAIFERTKTAMDHFLSKLGDPLPVPAS